LVVAPDGRGVEGGQPGEPGSRARVRTDISGRSCSIAFRSARMAALTWPQTPRMPGTLMLHPFGPEQIGDACGFHPGLMAEPQTVRHQPGQDRERAARGIV
jgi:hypothetical protein